MIQATKGRVNCQAFGRHVAVCDAVGKYGDWLFKKPLIHALRRAGHKVIVHHHPLSRDREKCDWALIYTRKERSPQVWWKNVPKVVEIQRASRHTEQVRIWTYGVVSDPGERFWRAREQERVQAVVEHLGLVYEERSVTIQKPQGRVIAVSINVSDREVHRLNFKTREIATVYETLRCLGFSFRVIKNPNQTYPAATLYQLFNKEEIVETPTFHAARRIVNVCDFFLGADSGLAHYAVARGKIVCALYSARYHGPRPLFQTAFDNHLCYFGDQAFAKKLLADLQQLIVTRPEEKLRMQTERFVRRREGIPLDPYANARKIHALRLMFTTGGCRTYQLVRQMLAHSSGIFFADEIIEADTQKLNLIHGPLFVDSKKCVEDLVKMIATEPDAEKTSLYAKPCSFFYGTALNNGSSDLDLPTVYLPEGARHSPRLLKKVRHILKKHGLCTDLPHQTPVLVGTKMALRYLQPIVKNGRPVFAWCVQKDKDHFEKYKARLKVKIILGEMVESERLTTQNALRESARGKRFLREIVNLEKENHRFKEWATCIRMFSTAMSCLGQFGTKGHLLLTIGGKNKHAFSSVVMGLMRHGVVYASGPRLYLMWDVRRPQHGWFQPITVVNAGRTWEREIRKALKSRIYDAPPLDALKRLQGGRQTPQKLLRMLESPEPLVYIESYHHIASHKKQYGNTGCFSRGMLQAYVREKESNCNNSRDRKLSLWSIATGTPLPLTQSETNQLTKYNCFAHAYAHGGTLDPFRTGFFRVRTSKGVSAVNFVPRWQRQMGKLLREYYVYTCVPNLPSRMLREKMKEILFTYYVQGRVLLEGPEIQARAAAKKLCELNIRRVFSNKLALLEAIKRFPADCGELRTIPLIAQLLRAPTAMILDKNRSSHERSH